MKVKGESPMFQRGYLVGQELGLNMLDHGRRQLAEIYDEFKRRKDAERTTLYEDGFRKGLTAPNLYPVLEPMRQLFRAPEDKEDQKQLLEQYLWRVAMGDLHEVTKRQVSDSEGNLDKTELIETPVPGRLEALKFLYRNLKNE